MLCQWLWLPSRDRPHKWAQLAGVQNTHEADKDTVEQSKKDPWGERVAVEHSRVTLESSATATEAVVVKVDSQSENLWQRQICIIPLVCKEFRLIVEHLFGPCKLAGVKGFHQASR